MTPAWNMGFGPLSHHQVIEVRGFKWPYRPTAIAKAYLLGNDTFGHWLGVTKDSPWWFADGSRSGVFEHSFVKLVPDNSFWTVCFHPVDPLVDVDIILPVRWHDTILEEVDLELDVLRFADGRVQVRDQDVFERVCEEWAMPKNIATQAEATFQHVRTLVEQGAEPFGMVGRARLTGFLATTNVTHA